MTLLIRVSEILRKNGGISIKRLCYDNKEYPVLQLELDTTTSQGMNSIIQKLREDSLQVEKKDLPNLSGKISALINIRI